MTPNLSEEKKLWKRRFKKVVGLDEVGRGPLAGPVVAAAVVIQNTKCKIPRSNPFGMLRGRQDTKIRDSKKLTPKQREKFYKILTAHPAIDWGIGRVSEKMIDRINILEATKLAMERAVDNLHHKVDYLILDGRMKLSLRTPQRSIVKADEKVFSCALASIFAKVVRDRIMTRYHKKYPRYGFDRHKGYPTRHHIKMLKRHGFCKIHRKSFRPVIQY